MAAAGTGFGVGPSTLAELTKTHLLSAQLLQNALGGRSEGEVFTQRLTGKSNVGSTGDYEYVADLVAEPARLRLGYSFTRIGAADPPEPTILELDSAGNANLARAESQAAAAIAARVNAAGGCAEPGPRGY